MEQSRILYRRYKTLFISYIMLLILSFVGLLMTQKGDFVILLNAWHQPALDSVMVSVTKAGEYWGFFFVLIILLSFTKYRQVLSYLIACAIMLGLVSLFKHIVFSDFMRPAVVLEEEHLHFVRGLYVNKKFSFPSGHTTAAFTYFFFFALTQKKTAIHLISLLAAVLIGGSRIYLAQHFLMDVVAGSMLGVLIAGSVYYFISEKWLVRYPKLDGSLR
jgi:membrane-associated phospholipid phosphatase